jgi:hypothetical protein
MAIEAPPSNKAAATPISAVLVMIFSTLSRNYYNTAKWLNELTLRYYFAPASQSDNSSSRSRHRHDASDDDAGDDSTRLAQSH